MVNILLKSILLILIHNVSAANILAVLPTPSTSLPDMYTSLLQEISKHHEVILITANQPLVNDKALKNITIIDLHKKLNRIWQKYNNVLISDENRDVVSEVSLTLSTNNNFCEALLQADEVKKFIEEKHLYFDLLFLEAPMTPLLSLSHIFNIPVILISSTEAVFDNYEVVGAPTHPILYPSIFQRRIYNITVLEKFVETSTYINLKLKVLANENKVDVWLKEYFEPNFPSVSELKRRIVALFVNSNPVWSGNRPVPANVVFMGGTGTRNGEPLSQDLQSLLDNSINGVIYVSFGSVIRPSQLPPEKLLRILNVLSAMPYDVILKWGKDRLPGVPKNIKIYKWVPQSSLLVHPKVKLFITQGGIQSTFEAIDAGVPLIGIPMYFEHWYNTEKYIYFNIGLQLDFASITEEKLIEAIYLVIKNESYQTSIKELRTLMYQQPGSSMERAIWWIEQALKPHTIRYLRSPAANISWREYLELDFIFFLLLTVFVIAVVTIGSITLFIRYIRNSFNDIKRKVT